MNPEAVKAIRQLKALSKDVKDMRLSAEDWKSDFQTLVSTMLSARTRDEVTISVSKKLFQKYPNPESLSKADIRNVESIIKPVNYYKTKSKNIISCSKKIVEDFNGKVPRNEESLLQIPGVGRKTANVFLSEIGKDAIGVDTHVSYISQKLGWTKNSAPEKIEKDLKNLFPKEYWRKINPSLVRFGKSHSIRKQEDKILREIKQNN